MSRKKDYHVPDDAELQELVDFGPESTVDLDTEFYDDSMPVNGQDDTSSVRSTDSRRRYQRSASIAVATEPTSTGLSFILDMDKEEAVEHSQSLHEDIEKLFDRTPTFSLDELTSGAEVAVPSTIGIVEEEIPKWAESYFDDRDFKRHRRASFPHAHHVLGSISSHSSKNFAALVKQAEDEAKKKAKKAKKEKKKKKNKSPEKPKRPIFPSKSAALSPAIPEVDIEEFSDSEDSEGNEEDDVDGEDNEGTSTIRFADESEASLPQLDDRASSPKALSDRASPKIIVTETTEDTDTAAPFHYDENVSSPKAVTYSSESDQKVAAATLALEVVTPTDVELIQFDEFDSKLLPLPLPLPRVSSILSSASSDLSGYMQDKAPVPDPNILRVKAEGDGGSFVSRGSRTGSPHPGFYIGSHPEHPDTPTGTFSYDSDIGKVAVDEKPVVILLENASSSEDDESEKSPLISTSAKLPSDLDIPTSEAQRVSIDKVMFQLGENEENHILDTSEEEQHFIQLLKGEEGPPPKERSKTKEQAKKRDEPDKMEKKKGLSDDEKNEKQHRRGSSKSLKSNSSKHHKHHHHHHHHHHKMEDLLSRRQRGSEVTLSDALHRVPTETEEAILLHKADLDEMASHRFEDPQGMRRHKIERKKHKTVSSVVHIGKKDKIKRKYFKPSKKSYDHSPHEVFVELDELYHGDKYDYEWREKARWIKFEEDVEEGADRWGKPHVASLSFHSLLELRKGLENGSLLLDLEASDLSTIVHRVVEDMVIHDQIKSENRGHVLRMLLMKHKFVGDGIVRTFIRRNKSFQNLFGLDERHQKDQMSLIKTLSSASLAQRQSSTNLQSLENHSEKQVKRQVSRSVSVPNDSFTDKQLNNDFEAASKKVRIKENGNHDPGKLEFVKVDVDNNMANDVMKDGVHIGIVPESKDQKSDQKHDLLRRIPRDAEACTVLVGCLENLDKPAMAFVRLAERQILENLTEVPLPVRFIFILLGPEGSMDYHEVGRSLSTLMSNQHFHEIAYKAESRSEILHAINEFLNESIVLPPGDWDQKTLLPVMDMARKRAKIRRKKLKKKDEWEALLKKEEIDKIPLDPLKRTGRPFGGLINDMKRRYRHYVSDFTDAFNLQCLTALIFIFFACLASCIAFGGLIEEKTYGRMGVAETILSTSITNIVFGFLSTQPLMLVGPTGPVLVFEKHLYNFCKTSHIEFLTWRVWIGLWVFAITILVIAVEGSFLVRYITRFTEEVFAILISLIFIFEVIHKLQEIYSEHPLRTKAFYCDNGTYNAIHAHSVNVSNSSGPIVNYTTAATTEQTSTYKVLNTTVINSESDAGYTEKEEYLDDVELYKQMNHYSEHFNEPNTALLSTILILGTFLIAYFLRIFRNSKFLGRSARRALGDFGLFIAIILMVLFDYFLADTFTQKLNLPETLAHTDQRLTSWFINPLGMKKRMEVWHMFIAIIPAFLIFILLFLEVQLTEMLMHKKEFKLNKGSGFHVDQFLLGLMTFICALFGLPWMCAATVRTIAHVSALSVMSRTHAPGEKPKLLEVKDQRVTNITMNILIGTALLWGPVLRAVPIAVLFGVFLYLGVSAISGVQLYKRIKLLFMPVKHHPGKSYVRRVKTLKMHMFTLIQIVLVIVLWVVKSTIAAIVFPLLVFLLIPLRLKVLPKIFTKQELAVLDKEEEDSDDEEDEDPDFYQLAHMPI